MSSSGAVHLIRRKRSSIGTVFGSLWTNRNLAGEMIRRDIRERYITQTFSWLWMVLQPVLTIGAYLVVFGYIFNGRVGADSSRTAYAVFLLSGLLPWIVSTDILTRAVTAVSGMPSFVKQMIFPVEVLPLKIFGSAMVSFLLSSALFLGYVVANGRAEWFTIAAWPVSLACLSTFLIGASYILSATGVFLRDMRDLVQIYTSLGLFASPTLYELHTLPAPVRAVIALNPITPFILMFQDSVAGMAHLHPFAWIAGPIVAGATLLAGFAIFSTLRSVMGEVL